MVKVCIPKRNQFGRKTIISKKKPAFGLKQHSGRHFTRYSVGSDSHYVPKKGVKLSKC